MGHFLQKFQTQYPLEIEKLASALRDKNREAVYRAAHSFRPQLEFVGLPAVGGLVLRLEQGSSGSLSFEELALLLEQVKTALQRFLIDHT